ncbi:HTH-type transcriptional regulator CysL [Abditibacteriota bacterium]|nr:HTH-type transcriptional regulator CysL [Abditibacteriota bacterium]
MALNLHLLRLFMTVAEQGSFSRAAQVAHISQPAVSKGIQELEKQVGLPLLERGARGVRLTEAGSRLQEHAGAIFAAERVAEEELRAYRGLSGGTLRIGASLTIANYYLPPILARFIADYPDLNLHLTSQNTETIVALLLDYKLDVVLVEGPVHHERIEVRKWREDELVVVAASQHPLALRAPITAADLNDAVWVVREPGSGTREVVEKALLGRHLRWKHTLEINSTAAIKQTVASGLGLAMVSLHSAADQIALGKLRVLSISDLKVTRPLTSLHLKNRPLSLAARTFEKFIFE